MAGQGMVTENNIKMDLRKKICYGAWMKLAQNCVSSGISV
jgi:hypothetical protein